jgi:beta-glucosidase-like glycosyl hydrolase
MTWKMLYTGDVAEGIETVMTAHISLPCIDLTRPATLSPDVMGILGMTDHDAIATSAQR